MPITKDHPRDGVSANEFSVYQFFPDGQSECLLRFVSAEEAVNKARDYTRPTRPAVILGVIDRVIITDGGNYCCFEWRNGKGVTFPPAQQESTQ